MRLDLIVLLPILFLLVFLPRLLGDRPVPNADVSVRVDEQRASHILYRKNMVAAHLNVLSGASGRILTAFPAGNSGVAVWLSSPRGEVSLSWTTPPESTGGQRQMVTFGVRAAEDEVVITKAVLGSVRSIRDYDIDHLKAGRDPRVRRDQRPSRVGALPSGIGPRGRVPHDHHRRKRHRAQARRRARGAGQRHQGRSLAPARDQRQQRTRADPHSRREFT